MKQVLLLLTTLLLLACSKRSNSELDGGTIRMCLETEPITYLTYEVSDYYSATVFGQVMEGLVSIDPGNLKIKAQIASRWDINDDGTEYTFTIREGILFHPHEVFSNNSDRVLVPEDVVKTFELICSPTTTNSETAAYGHLLKDVIIGASEFYEKKSTTIEGVSAHENTVVIKIKQKDDNFLFKLAQVQLAIHAAEIIEANLVSKIIGTGPFKFEQYITGEVPQILLSKNEEYYELDDKGNALPYVDSIQFLIQSRKLEQLDMFENKQIDLILALPTSKITKMVEGRLSDFNSTPPKLVLNKNALLQTHYYIFNMEDPRFQNIKVRQAFNYAVDRERIGRDILKNQFDELGFYGVVPPLSSIFRGYEFQQIRKVGYDYNPEKARKLLAEAGYPNGKDFGTVNLRFRIDDINAAVSDEFSQQILQVLGINVNIDGSNFEQLTSDAIESNGDLFKSSWIADYPNPENFLINFQSSNKPDKETNARGLNYAKYNNPLFDNLLEEAKRESNIGKKMKLYTKAEVELMKNPPIIPLWHSGDLQIVHSYVRDLHFNSLSLFDFKKVYLQPWSAEEYQKEIANKK